MSHMITFEIHKMLLKYALVTGFVDRLYVPLGNTSDYSAVGDLHA
jgi:hypothetical protein